ncbi:hypothetical protein HYV84_05645 [Candidatus Woesearchaeota archaeon]|nr:hypothetical protein [Candidatus Woesearchaeota archaeon]
MKNKTMALLSMVALVLIATIIVAQSNTTYLKRIIGCKNITSSIMEPLYGNCTRDYTERVCQDPPLNTTCQNEAKTHTYKCITSTGTVQKSSLDCSPNSFEISRELTTLKHKIEFSDWGMCTQESDNVIICDSKFDGNSDGKCTSGESCTKFLVTSDGVESYVRNSRDDWVVGDDSFFLEKLQALEVAK